jgi:hypothetical protein
MALGKGEVIAGMTKIYNDLKEGNPSFDFSELEQIGEGDALERMNDAMMEYLDTLPHVVPLLPPATVADVEASLKGKRRTIPILTGNEFIIGTLSKINIILTKLIAEYNGKILVNYKKFLQSDLEEIALKIIDTQRRFNDLITYLQDYERGDKSVDIRKFLETIDNKFKQFIALSSRSIANFVNPNIQFLPNFSQQLSGKTFENQTQPFNLYQEILGNEQNIAEQEQQRQILLEEFNADKNFKVNKIKGDIDELKLYIQQEYANKNRTREQNALVKQMRNELKKLEGKLSKEESKVFKPKKFRPLVEDAFLPAVPDENSRLARQYRDLTETLGILEREYQSVARNIATLSGRDSLSPREQRDLGSLRNERDNIVEAEERNRNILEGIRARLLELAM